MSNSFHALAQFDVGFAGMPKQEIQLAAPLVAQGKPEILQGDSSLVSTNAHQSGSLGDIP